MRRRMCVCWKPRGEMAMYTKMIIPFLVMLLREVLSCLLIDSWGKVPSPKSLKSTAVVALTNYYSVFVEWQCYQHMDPNGHIGLCLNYCVAILTGMIKIMHTHTCWLKVKDAPSGGGGGGGLPGQRTTDYAELDTPAQRLSSVVPAPSAGAASTVSRAKFDIVKEQLKKAQV